MSNEDYIKENPHQFNDELDKWLFREFGILGGACSSIESMKCSVAREVAEKAMEYAKEQMMKDAIDGEVYFSLDLLQYRINTEPLADFHHGDKVKLIIIKDE